MALNDDLQELVAELDRFHSGNTHDPETFAQDLGFPDFVTAENGLQRHFTKKARIALDYVSRTIFDNSREIAAFIGFKDFVCVVRQCVADMHAANCFPVGWADGDAQVKAQLVTEIKSRVAMMAKEYTHYFPAWTLGMEAEAPFSLGPVTLFTKQQWLDGVDFSDRAKDTFLMERDANHRWKQILKDALAQPSSRTPLNGLEHFSLCRNWLGIPMRCEI